MRTIRLGRTNATVPVISVGTWSHGGPNKAKGRPVGWAGQDDRLAVEALVRAHQSGLVHWDTADVYGDGHAEELIGSVWDRVPREQIFLASKVGWDSGGHRRYYHPDVMRSQLERSLRNLRTDHIDLYYLHHCDFGRGDERLDDAAELMQRFRSEGKIRFIGLSDWDSKKLLRYTDRVQPDVVQPYRNIYDDSYASSGLKAWVEEHDAGVAFFSPLKHGLLLGKYQEPTRFEEGDFRANIPEFRDAEALARLRSCREALEERFRDRPQPVLYALTSVLLSDSLTGCVLLGLRNPDQVEAAAQIGQVMTAEDATWVRQLYRDI